MFGGWGDGEALPLHRSHDRVKGHNKRRTIYKERRTRTWAGAAEADGGIPKGPAGAVEGKGAGRKAARIAAAGGAPTESTGGG